MNKKAIEYLFEAFHQHNPEPKCALDYTNDFTLLVAILLSAQSTDVGVNKITPRLFEEAPNPKAMLALGKEKLSHLIHATGFYRRKAELLLSLCVQLIERHGGKVPTDVTELEALSGIGPKSANVFLNVYYGEPRIAVDRHVFRVARRLGLSDGSNPQQVEKDLNAVVPEKWKSKAAHWLVLHGRTTCKAQRPRCATCFVRQWCQHPLLSKSEKENLLRE